MSRRSRINRMRPQAVSGQARQPASSNTAEDRLVAALDDLSLFTQFQSELLPDLRKMIQDGASTKDILGRARALAVARLTSLAVMEPDSKVALSAVKELLDRLEGKPTEKKEITHAMAKLKDEELDALVLTALNESGDSE